ncbi:MAG: replication-associated recombination protein A [Bacteroidota bacterium]
MELFEEKKDFKNNFAPLAERVRPNSLGDFVGQKQILGNGKALSILLNKLEIPSIIFWGPPGSGKTTLARIISKILKREFHQLNAVSSGVKEVRSIIEIAERKLKTQNKKTILFIDEIHRFNKSQQDALLHSVEEGIITLIGATTENPSFEVISPLLSRSRVFVLEPLSKNDLEELIFRAIKNDSAFSNLKINFEEDSLDALINFSGGDARMLLNAFEIAIQITPENNQNEKNVTHQIIEEAFQKKLLRYDANGEEHYNTISAFIKSLRGSDPDAAIYYLARMLESGEDILFIARRMIVLASEDIGNANPQALVVATSCANAIHQIGMPEARIILSQVAIYLASSPKSNSSYIAIEKALSDAKNLPQYSIPLHLRNAPTKLMKEFDYGKDYKYAHNFKDNFVEQQFLPDEIKDKIYYSPTQNGEEKIINERLKKFWKKRNL